ncbi:M48 family metalloprotease [Maricurvus nonylphenolicus]|uniref:M48 family metalloprotease n=1 Tax=Maricurvus nonylphenolicus TaxID=1008307 RepID=UPI0036F313FF
MSLPSLRQLSRKLLQTTLLATTLGGALIVGIDNHALAASNLNLPELGDASSGIVSRQKEFELGQTWLRLYRSQVPTSSDPLLHDYVEQLLTQLARHSELKDRTLELIVVKNPSMNAFAVPGGVVGVHTGLFLFAQNEDQLSSVLAHELAHLSQRHFARGVEQRQKASIPTMAAMLASLVLAATAGGDAGLAAMTATQAAALDSQLRFSRQNEQEADRIGMKTMVSAGKDPNAVPEMFESMLRSTRYSRRPPEFLLTHPVTESRIADSRNRASQYPARQYPDNLDFHLMRARIRLKHENTPQDGVKRFVSELEGESSSPEASRYGLVLALTATNQTDRAREAFAPLKEKSPDKTAYILAEVDIEVADDNLGKALNLLEGSLKQWPQSHPLNVRYAEVLMKSGEYALCEEVLQEHVKRRPKDDYVWYLLAEVHGLAGNILGVHQARAEYFILNGVYDKAQQQLRNALKLSQGNYHQTALLEERLKQVTHMQRKKM